MNELTTLLPPTLEIIDGVPTVLSTVVADYFGYRHDNLLQIIRGLIARNSELYVSYIFRRQPQAVHILKIRMSLLSPQHSE